MAYTKQEWVNSPTKTTPINAARLNHIEEGIKTANLEIGICSTARNVNAKVVTIDGFKLTNGARIIVRFTDTGTSNPTSGNLTLNVNGTGAKQIVISRSNKTIMTYAHAGELSNNIVCEFVYDGTYWVYLNRDTNNTYNGASLKTSVAKTGSGSTVTNTIATNTSMNDAIGTLLNNDYAINQNLTSLLTKDIPHYRDVSLKTQLADLANGEVRIFTQQNCSGYTANNAMVWSHCIIMRNDYISSTRFGLMFDASKIQTFYVESPT